MKMHKLCIGLLALFVFGAFVGCSTSTKSPDVTGAIRKSLDQAGLKNVSVTQDREKGVVTLSGNVADGADKAKAETLAKSVAGDQVVANQIVVTPPGAESEAKTVNADVDAGIKKNLDAALTSARVRKHVDFDVNNGVVTLTGRVRSARERARIEKAASSVPNVKQVVNELKVQRATSTE